ncbi:protoporphyrinogen/coproporphyrinogen oxidase [Candidatus Chloroploca asiatica]|uniref:Amine oxidase domain-containing protein n=1 Tax=Candidatus Chloroploca asiatica TaxID=1506545 RepID=A0A2H3LA78_9CHLR|nr:FAD-dependent oxidoreductase [Candidatus Chloroploca asiatica]PDV99261.1 hypothetical protein A9Q02_12935 [Candidatus Chloroploca asiatica]
MKQQRHILVIGGGLAGLAAARYLQAAGATVTLLEREREVGGRARTALVDGYAFELGAEFLASFYTRTLALVGELGLHQHLQRIPRSSAILRDGQLYPLWPNLRLAFTHLIRSQQKLPLTYLLASLARHRTRLDLYAFHKAYPIDDQDVSSYALAHFSRELLEYVLQPPIAGIFYWTPERTSRALLLLVLKAGFSRPTGLQLFTLRGGLGGLARALAGDLQVRLGVEVRTITPQTEGGYTLHVQDEDGVATLEADGIVIATTATAVPHLLPWLDHERRRFFEAIVYSQTANLALGTRTPLPQATYGLLFPRRETPFLASATLQTVKDPTTAPAGRAALCLHLSGPATAALRQQDDDTLARLMLADLRRLLPMYDPTPGLEVQRLYRCPEALPEFNVGHFQRLKAFADGAIEQGQIVFAGDYLGGPFIEGALVSGEQAAQRLLQRMA